ncbi:MAG TPA: hypothetical protein VEN78_38515 [Bradyrhizobium sp.]|nr:hypothetical protein [Bradyrhizobium sp.]
MIAQGAELDLEPVDRVALFTEFRKLAGVLGLELLDVHFETSRRHNEFGAQQILVGQDFRRRQGGRAFEPPSGQPHRATMDEGHDDEHAEGREEKSDPEIHHRFDHGHRLKCTYHPRKSGPFSSFT